jgi:surface polysaccharide O-acyltransferase-like enzyme
LGTGYGVEAAVRAAASHLAAAQVAGYLMRSVEILEEPGARDAAVIPAVTAAPVSVAPSGAVRRAVAERLANVERVRLVAMFEIVAFHVSDQRLPVIAGLGLPAFLLLNNAFNCTLSERMGARPFLRVKVSKLLLPWFVWSLVYALVVVLEKLRHHESLTEAVSPWMIVGGTYEHLWFVPFALFGAVFVAWLQLRTRALAHSFVVFAALASGGALAVACASIVSTGSVNWPMVQWLFALPSPLLGFALGRALLTVERSLLARLTTVVALLALTCSVLSLLLPVPEMVSRYAVSLGLVSLAFVWPGRGDPLSRRVTPLLFGIYLIHPLILRLYQAAHLPVLPVAWFAALVFVTSALLVLGLQRTPLRRLV